MNQIVISDSLLAEQFQHAQTVAEVLNASGEVIGTFRPRIPMPMPPYGIKSPYTVEQLDAFEQEPGAGSLADFWKSMGRSS